MNEKTIYTKTAKGLSEASGRARALPRDLRDILKEIDGTSSVEDLTDVLGMPADKLREALAKLAVEEYIHEFVPPSVAEEDEFDLGLPSLRGTSDPLTEVTIGAFLRASEQQTEQAGKEEAAARAQREAEERARQLAGEQARRAAEEQARREAEEELRRAGERKRRAEDERARKDAEKQARQEAKAKAKQEAKERVRRKHEGKIEPVAVATATLDVGNQSERAAEDLAGQEHMRTRTRAAGRRSAETVPKPAARQKTEKQERIDEKRSPVISIRDRKPFNMQFKAPFTFHWPFRTPIKWVKPAAIASSVLLLAGAVVALTTTYDGKAVEFATLATAQFGQPVSIGKVRLALLPQPHWRLEDVSIGKQGQIKVAQIDAVKGFTLFSDMTVYKSVSLVSPVVNEEGLGWLMFAQGATQNDHFRIEQINAADARFASNTIELPAFRVDAAFGGDGNWKTIRLDTDDRTVHLDLRPQRNAVHVDMILESTVLPFGSAVKFDNIHASGSATHGELSFPKFTGKVLGGFIDGSAVVKWGEGWKLEGNAKATQIDTPAVAPHLLEGGKLDGTTSFAMEAPTAGGLFSAANLDGNVSIRNCVVLGVNMAGVLRGISPGGRSPFTLLESEFSRDHGRIQIRNLHGDAGAVSTSGNADIDAAGKINGRFAVDLQTTTRQTRAFVGLGGTVDVPKFHR
jgi:hypothetical protein